MNQLRIPYYLNNCGSYLQTGLYLTPAQCAAKYIKFSSDGKETMFVQLQAKVCKRLVNLEIVKSDLISYSHQLISLNEFFNFCKSYKIAFLLTRPTGAFLLNRVLNLLELNTRPSPSVLPSP